MVAAAGREVLSAERLHVVRGSQLGRRSIRRHRRDLRRRGSRRIGERHHDKPGPCWRRQLPEPKVVELVRAGRIVLAHWESGDLAAQIRRLSRALEEFVQLPDEG